MGVALDRDRLIREAAAFGVAVDDGMAQRFSLYADLLAEWNERMNLTAITDPEGILYKHFLDSIAAAPCLPAGALRLIDVGSGAGFPGVPLAIVRPDIELTLLDSLGKRLTFLQALCDAIGLRARLIHARAEEGGRRPDLREQFDAATARAVAALPVLCEYCLPFVKPGGRFLALKGPDGDTELSAAANAIGVLGGKAEKTRAFTLPGGPEGEPAHRPSSASKKERPHHPNIRALLPKSPNSPFNPYPATTLSDTGGGNSMLC